MAVKRPLKKPAESTFDVSAYVEKFKVWAQTKTLADKGKNLHEKMNKDDLKPLVLKHGQKDPETGSYFLEFPDEVEAGAYGKVDGVTAQASNKRNLNEERAVEFLTRKTAEAFADGEFTHADGETKEIVTEDFDLLKEAQETITVLSEDRLIALHLLGKITEEDLDSLYDTETTYSFIPHKV